MSESLKEAAQEQVKNLGAAMVEARAAMEASEANKNKII